MSTSGPVLEPGHVYRTRDLSQWTSNPARLARRLVEKGQFKPLAQGLFVHPRQSRFGVVPPADEEVMRAFLDAPFVFTGPEQWNALGLGTSTTFATQLVYNTKRSGEFTFGGRRFLLRRVAFPEHQSPEWFVVDLLQHAEQAAADRDDLTTALASAVRSRRFDTERLRSMAKKYGSLDTQARVASALAAAEPVARRAA